MEVNVKLSILLGVFLFTLKGYSSILPENNLHLEDNLKTINAVTEQEFNDIIDEVAEVYSPIVALHGGKLNMIKDWKTATVNAYASQRGSTWDVKMFGGLARRKEVTKDGFALVVCHELGHHLAGFPFYAGGDWAASEGQSDYYATQVCARRVWSRTPEENATYREIVPQIVKDECDKVWHSERSQNLCYRISFASMSLGSLLAVLGWDDAPSFETPDDYEISQTNTAHPQAQCRLDTYFQGSLCNQGYDPTVIPARNHSDGQESIGAELIAALYSCSGFEGHHPRQTRPKCWFKPELESNFNSSSSEQENDSEEPSSTLAFK